MNTNLHIIKYRTLFFSLLAGLSLLLTVVSCDDDDNNGSFNQASIEQLLKEAQDLIDNGQEGINLGDYKPGSKKELQEVVTWVMWKMENSSKQEDIDDAAEKLAIYIAKFKANKVSMAIPWIQQENDTYIMLSDNPEGSGTNGKLKQITSSPFTIEAKFYILDLQQRGYSNNLFANVMGEGGANDRGFDIRYFGDGHVHINVGGGDGWKDVTTGPGVISAGKWIHISYVNNITSHKLYVDGNEVLSSNYTYANSDDKYPVTIGNTSVWSDRAVNAMVQDVRIWTEARTGEQIMETMATTLTGKESKLASYFPLNADLGKEFADATNQFKANLKGSISWLVDGIPPVIELNFAALNKAINNAETLKASVVEGTETGAFPAGTIAYLQSLIDEGTAARNTAKRQNQIDEMASKITDQIELVKEFLVAESDGVYIDRENSDAVGLRITPNYTPQGDFTVEFDLNLKTLLMKGGGNGEIFGNGTYGLRVYGYKELTEAEILKSGALWNFNETSAGWKGAKTAPLAVSPGAWQHIAIVHDKAAQTTAIFVDGKEMAKETNLGEPNISGWGEIWLGNSWGEKMNGSIKNFRIWNSVKSASEFGAPVTGSESDLEMCFPLTKVAGVKFKDQKGNYDAEIRGIKWNAQ